jgi:hypothetical protein
MKVGLNAKKFWRRILKCVVTPRGCWEWQSRISEDGYALYGGGLSKNKCEAGRRKLAHRTSYEFFVSPIPENLCVLHQCDNRRCVNPTHLFLGTRNDNNKDRMKKGRNGDRSGERNGKSKFTEAEIRSIRNDYAGGETQESIASRHSVHHSTIGRIVGRRTWSSVS